jgi:DNA-binding beta-propeller fold protein YncE
MRVKSGWALVLAVASLLAFSSCSNSNNATTGSGIVWVATSGDQTINTYTINSTSGAGSRVGNGVPSGVQPSAMVMTPDRKSIFVADAGEIRAFSVRADGTLSALGSPVPVTPSPSGIAVDPTGKLLFVVSQGNAGGLGQPGTVPGAISVFNISGSAAPTPVANSPFPSALPGDSIGNGPVAVAVSPVGGYVYVANQFTNTLGAFSYDATAGTLAFIAAYNTGANPAGLAFSRCAGGKVLNANCTGPDGDTLFVANSGLSNNISIFTACIELSPTCASPTGRLQAVSVSPVPVSGIGPSSVIVSPVLDFVYVVETQSNGISQFKYGPANGSLTALSPPSVSTGAGPLAGGITSDGTFVIVPDSGGSELAVFKADNTVSSTGAAPTGVLTRASTPSITLAGQPTAIVVR